MSRPDDAAGAATDSSNGDATPPTTTTSNVVVGFDVEWRPNFVPGGSQNKVALVQLATARSAILIQLKFVGLKDQHPHPPDDEAKRRMMATLAHVLDSDRIVKVGVGVFDDLLKVERDFGLPFRNFVDLGLAAKRYVNWSMLAPAGNEASTPPSSSSFLSTDVSTDSIGTVVDEDRWLCCVDGKCISATPQQQLLPLPKSGLAALVSRFLGINMPKPRSVRTSNWELQTLSDTQVVYAAYDALFGRLVFDHLQSLGAFCRRDQRSFADHVFATESARARVAPNTISGADTADSAELAQTETPLSNDSGVDGLQLPAASDECVGGLIRTSFRRVGGLALESGWLLHELGSRVQREDLAWLQSLEDGTYATAGAAAATTTTVSHGNSSGVSKETKTVWRQALLRYLSRMGWTLRFDTTTINSDISGSGGGGSRGNGSSKITAESKITVAVVVGGRILAEDKGASKAAAAEAACRNALYELITAVQPRLSPADTINFFGGRKQGVHVAFTSYLDSKIPSL